MNAERGKTGIGAEDTAVLAIVDRGPTLTDKVYARLRRGLLLGTWNPGQKITARQLSRDFGVSLTPVREAMMRLASEGALDISETRAFITPLLDLEQYREVIQLRIAVEPLAIAAATPLMSDETIASLFELNEQIRDLLNKDEFNEALQLDSEFHLTIYAQAARPTMYAIIDNLWLRAGPTRNLLSHKYRKSLLGYKNHQCILAALKARDAKAASEALARDLSQGSVPMLEILARQSPQKQKIA